VQVAEEQLPVFADGQPLGSTIVVGEAATQVHVLCPITRGFCPTQTFPLHPQDVGSLAVDVTVVEEQPLGEILEAQILPAADVSS